MTLKIRTATVSDVPYLTSVITEGIGIWGKDIQNNIKPWFDVVSSPSYIRDTILSEKRTTFIVEMNDAPVATIYLEATDETEVHMGGLYCSVRKAGLGTLLMKHVLDYSASHGYKTMTCEIYEKNYASIGLMEKFGAKYSYENTMDDVTYNAYEFDLVSIPALV